MRRGRVLVLWAGLLAGGVAGLCAGEPGAAQTAGTGAVTGHVYSAETNQPCRFATVSVRDADGEGGSGTATTDLDGAFTVGGLSPGSYTVTAQMPGYLVTRAAGGDAGTGGGNAAAPLVKVEANQQTPVELRLERGAALSGTVRYDDGSPAPGLLVRLFQRQSNGAWKGYSNATGGNGGSSASARTDDRGRYRIAGLPAGVYAAEADLPASSSATRLPNGTEPGRRSTLFLRAQPGQALRVYSGNVFRVREATGVEVHAGDERGDGDVQIPLAGLHTLQGVVEARSTGRSVGGGQVRLLDPQDRSVLRETPIGEGGAFVFSYVPNGSYLVHVEARGADRREASPFSPLEQPLTVEGDSGSLAYEVGDAGR